MHKLFFDTETGGLDCNKHSLLTAFFAICDENLNIIDELDLKLKPSDVSLVNCDAEALAINKIDLDAHLNDPETVTYEEGARLLTAFLEKNKIKGKRKSYQPCGHNVGFDKDFLWAQLISKAEFERLVHYRTLDTSIVCSFLKDVGIFPEDVGSLTSLVVYLKLPMREAHTARDDIYMNIGVYKEMKKLVTANKINTASSSLSSSLLSIIES